MERICLECRYWTGKKEHELSTCYNKECPVYQRDRLERNVNRGISSGRKNDKKRKKKASHTYVHKVSPSCWEVWQGKSFVRWFRSFYQAKDEAVRIGNYDKSKDIIPDGIIT